MSCIWPSPDQNDFYVFSVASRPRCDAPLKVLVGGDGYGIVSATSHFELLFLYTIHLQLFLSAIAQNCDFRLTWRLVLSSQQSMTEQWRENISAVTGVHLQAVTAAIQIQTRVGHGALDTQQRQRRHRNWTMTRAIQTN